MGTPWAGLKGHSIDDDLPEPTGLLNAWTPLSTLQMPAFDSAKLMVGQWCLQVGERGPPSSGGAFDASSSGIAQVV